MEDINNLLNTGEVPNLFLQEEKIDITEKVKKNMQSDSKVELSIA